MLPNGEAEIGEGAAMPKVANVLFPADYFEKGAPDGAMRIEYESACAEKRLDVRVFDLELFEERWGAFAQSSFSRRSVAVGVPGLDDEGRTVRGFLCCLEGERSPSYDVAGCIPDSPH